MRGLGVLGLQGLNFFAALGGENADVVAGIFVRCIEPKLVELVGAGAVGIEPHVAALGLSKLGAVRLLDQGRRKGKGLAATHSADEFCAGRDIAPLVATPHLQTDAFFLPEVVKVVALDELVAEFGIANAAFLTALHRILCQHVVDGDVLAHVPNEVQKAEVFEPIVVVDNSSTLGAVKVEELHELGLLARQVLLQCFRVEQLAFGRLEGGIAHHAGRSAYQSVGLVARTLEVHEHHDLHQVADTQ